METVYRTQSATKFRILKMFENVWALITKCSRTRVWARVREHLVIKNCNVVSMHERVKKIWKIPMHGSTLNNTSATSKRSVNWDAVQKNSTWKIKKAQWEEAKELAGKLNKRSFWYTGIWYTLWLVNFDRFCQHWSITDADEICNLSMSEAVFKSVINNTLKDFPQCKWRVSAKNRIA